MDAFISSLQSPWAVVIGLAVAVLIGVVIRLAVSSRRRSSQDVTPQPQAQAPLEARSDTPAEASLDDTDQPRAGPADAVEPTPDQSPEAPATPASSIERPEPVRGRMERLRERLASSGSWVVRFSAFSAAASSVPPTGRRSRSLSSSPTSALRPLTR